MERRLRCCLEVPPQGITGCATGRAKSTPLVRPGDPGQRSPSQMAYST